MPGPLATICLATAIYFEGRGEPLYGREAIAEVVMNRGPNVCATVAASGQFMVYWRPQWHNPVDTDAWGDAQELAEHVVKGDLKTNRTHGALFFSRGLPPWAANAIRIGGHWFYKERRP